jgi:rhodanese-related sulfurtransferase
VTVEELVALTRTRLDRLTPVDAFETVAAGVVLVDIRPYLQRRLEGEVPGALVVERNVLEWRFDPSSDARLPIAAPDLRVMLLCQAGYTSSLAAVSLHEVGVPLATDVIGGYQAWRDAGLPTTADSPAARL